MWTCRGFHGAEPAARHGHTAFGAYRRSSDGIAARLASPPELPPATASLKRSTDQQPDHRGVKDCVGEKAEPDGAVGEQLICVDVSQLDIERQMQSAASLQVLLFTRVTPLSGDCAKRPPRSVFNDAPEPSLQFCIVARGSGILNPMAGDGVNFDAEAGLMTPVQPRYAAFDDLTLPRCRRQLPPHFFGRFIWNQCCRRRIRSRPNRAAPCHGEVDDRPEHHAHDHESSAALLHRGHDSTLLPPARSPAQPQHRIAHSAVKLLLRKSANMAASSANGDGPHRRVACSPKRPHDMRHRRHAPGTRSVPAT